MKITQVTPGLIPIPPNGWGAVEKIIWEYHCNAQKLGHQSEIKYLNDVTRDADIVHIHVANLALQAYERGIKYIFTLHDHHAYLYGKDSDVYKQNMEAIDKSVMSFVPAKYLIEYFDNHPKLQYLSHGVNTDFFNPGKAPDVHRLLCVANNGFANDQSADRKGFSYAIAAAKKLDIPLTIVGPSNNKKYFEKNPPDYDKLEIIYDATEDQLLEQYRRHTIFVHASVLEAGHPNLTLLEAMACGLPVVGTFEEFNDLAGLVKIERTVESVVAGILKAIDNYEKLRQLAIYTAKRHSYPRITEKLIDIYADTLETQGDMKKSLIKIYDKTPINIRPEIVHENTISCHFVKGATVDIGGDNDKNYKVEFINTATNTMEYVTTIRNKQWSRTLTEYYVPWHVKVWDGDKLVHNEVMNLKDRRVYIALESNAIGDTIAWFPIADEFRKHHGCKLVVSTFHNEWFEENYPEIEFIKPGDEAKNIYAQYNIGWFYKDGKVDFNRAPVDFKTRTMQETATSILGLPAMEVRPRMVVKQQETDIPGKYVVLAPHASAHAKYWNKPGGWQAVIDHLNKLGYTAVVLTQERIGSGHDYKLGGGLHGIYNKSGNIPMTDRIADIKNASLFIGLGSGLSWVSWALGTPTIMISGFSEKYTEMSDCIRIGNEKPNICRGCFNTHQLDAGDWDWCPNHKGTSRMFECSKTIEPEEVINAINKVLL